MEELRADETYGDPFRQIAVNQGVTNPMVRQEAQQAYDTLKDPAAPARAKLLGKDALVAIAKEFRLYTLATIAESSHVPGLPPESE